MSQGCDHNCSSCSSKCDQGIKKEQLHPLADVKKVIAIVSCKGGGCKSIVTSLMTVLMQRKGFNSAILDAALTGPSIPKSDNLYAIW